MRVIYTNSRGDSITFDQRPPYLLQRISGEGAVSSTTQAVKSPYQDGQTYIDSLLEMREINFRVALFGDRTEKRSEVSKVFNPKLGKGELRLEYNGTVRIIDAVPDELPLYPPGIDQSDSQYQEAEFMLICPNPYWRSETIESEPAFQGLFSFPFEGEFEMGLQQDARTITNAGDVPTPIMIDFNGPAVNPRIENVDTGEFIKVNRTLETGDLLKVNTTFGNVSVTINDENVLNWIDLESTFFQLHVGDNRIEYTADSDIQGAVVDMYWDNYFIGI